MQIRVGYLSDPTFLEEYYQPEFDSTLPYNAEFYAKRQQDTEALTFLAESDTTRFVTNSDRQQEQFDVARLPEITYQRIGDSFADDQLTLFSNTSGAVLKFDRKRLFTRPARLWSGPLAGSSFRRLKRHDGQHDFPRRHPTGG